MTTTTRNEAAEDWAFEPAEVLCGVCGFYREFVELDEKHEGMQVYGWVKCPDHPDGKTFTVDPENPQHPDTQIFRAGKAEGAREAVERIKSRIPISGFWPGMKTFYRILDEEAAR